MSNCCSLGTFLHFSLSSHLNICYYHQGLYQRRFDPGLWVRRLSVIHFQGWLIRQVTQSLASSDFYGHRPAVWINQHLLWGLMSVDFGTLTPLSVHPASPVLLTKNGPLGILFGHSSPSFGSQQAHSHSNPTTSGADRSMIGRLT